MGALETTKEPNWKAYMEKSSLTYGTNDKGEKSTEFKPTNEPYFEANGVA